jgi:hypothetical protein
MAQAPQSCIQGDATRSATVPTYLYKNAKFSKAENLVHKGYTSQYPIICLLDKQVYVPHVKVVAGRLS